MHDCGDMVTMKKQNLTGKAAETKKKGRTVVKNVVVTSAIQDLLSIDRNIFYSL